jgi:hypothetical protein
MPRPRTTVKLNVPVEIKAALVRQCRAHDRSQAKLFEIFVLNAEQGWLSHLTTEEQRRQYFSDGAATRRKAPAKAADTAA